jgi:transposase InsO family protein
LIYSSTKGLEEGKKHDTYPQYEVDSSKLLIFQDGVSRVCVPTSQRQLILKVMHDLPLGMHQATQKMHSLLSSRFYWPGMYEHVKKYVESCEHCQRNKPYVRGGRGPPHPAAIPFKRFDCVALDMLSGLATTKQGFDAIVVFTDRFTKRVYIEPCNKTATARDLALIFFRTVFRNQGMPRILLSDNGPQFASEFWKAFFELLQTDIRLTSSYHPQSNGQTERFNRTLIEALRSFVNARHDNWDEFLTHFEFAYNSTVNASTGFSPFILQFAQAPRAPWDSVLDQGGDEKRKMSGKDMAMSLGFDTLSNLKRARDSLHAAAQTQRVRNALRSAPHAYTVNEEVLLSTENIKLNSATRKMSPKYVGPFKITELLGKNAVRIIPTGRFSAIHDVINVEYIRPYKERSANVGPPPHHLSIKPIAVEPEGEWFTIAEILHHRYRFGPNQQFLVRWEGFDCSHDSWVPRRDITPKALKGYEAFLREEVKNAGPKEKALRQRELNKFLGTNDNYSADNKKQQAARGGAAKTSRGERGSDFNGDHPAQASASVPAASDSAPSNRELRPRQPKRYGKS